MIFWTKWYFCDHIHWSLYCYVRSTLKSSILDKLSILSRNNHLSERLVALRITRSTLCCKIVWKLKILQHFEKARNTLGIFLSLLTWQLTRWLISSCCALKHNRRHDNQTTVCKIYHNSKKKGFIYNNVLFVFIVLYLAKSKSSKWGSWNSYIPFLVTLKKRIQKGFFKRSFKKMSRYWVLSSAYKICSRLMSLFILPSDTMNFTRYLIKSIKIHWPHCVPRYTKICHGVLSVHYVMSTSLKLFPRALYRVSQ